ncbi:MAG: hypothetical protein OXF88_05415, partial [Rhodobacteraceae bacterium]|nr:hypothetical protein [Paracoccaceae bacterium]MCY4137786.1 hypothetical protein [Paracoccaceae bacterium]
ELNEEERTQETKGVKILWRNRYLCWVKANKGAAEKLNRRGHRDAQGDFSTPSRIAYFGQKRPETNQSF